MSLSSPGMNRGFAVDGLGIASKTLRARFAVPLASRTSAPVVRSAT